MRPHCPSVSTSLCISGDPVEYAAGQGGRMSTNNSTPERNLNDDGPITGTSNRSTGSLLAPSNSLSEMLFTGLLAAVAPNNNTTPLIRARNYYNYDWSRGGGESEYHAEELLALCTFEDFPELSERMFYYDGLAALPPSAASIQHPPAPGRPRAYYRENRPLLSHKLNKAQILAIIKKAIALTDELVGESISRPGTVDERP